LINSKNRVKGFASLMVLLMATFALTACSSSEETAALDLAPVPFELVVDENLLSYLSTEEVTGGWAESISEMGGTAVTVIYTPTAGDSAILMTAYSFSSEDFANAQNPNEPPMFGTVVIEADGSVLAVAGPQDSIYDPNTEDGKNVNALNQLIYLPESYR
jgi:hypothetical protein